MATPKLTEVYRLSESVEFVRSSTNAFGLSPTAEETWHAVLRQVSKEVGEAGTDELLESKMQWNAFIREIKQRYMNLDDFWAWSLIFNEETSTRPWSLGVLFTGGPRKIRGVPNSKYIHTRTLWLDFKLDDDQEKRIWNQTVKSTDDMSQEIDP